MSRLIPLLHGTTLDRANRLLRTGPDPAFVEPGGDPYSAAAAFSTAVEGAPDLGLGTAEDYARQKAALFPHEGGPALHRVEVPLAIVDIVRNDVIGAMVAASGEIRFEPGVGLEELRAAWAGLFKQVLPL